MDGKETRVVFRTYDDGETIAIFPEIKDNDGRTMGYSHNSRRFFVEYRRIMRLTRPAIRKEYIALFKELKYAGFQRLQVYKRARIKSVYIVDK
jgi:hypothetical protein